MKSPSPYHPRRRFLKQATACGLASLIPGALGGSDKLFLRVNVSLPKHRKPAGPLAFGLIADTHSGDFPDTDRPRFFRSSLGNVEETVEVFNQRGLDFAIHVGDVIQESGNRGTSRSWLRDMDGAFAQFTGPKHYVMGNHDLGDLGKNDFLEDVSTTFKAPHYYFDQAGYRFVILDPNFREDGTSYHRGNFSWTDSFIPPVQIEWLDHTLESAKKEGLPVIVFSHQCFDSSSLNHMIKNAAEVRALFAGKGNVAAVFYGHRHAGGYFNFNGIHYLGAVATVNGPDLAAMVVRLRPHDATGQTIIEIEGLGARQPNRGPYNAPV